MSATTTAPTTLQVCECPICVEPMKASVECPYCEFKACRGCCQTYLLAEAMPKCMNGGCNREWSRHFISTAFSPSFVSKPLKKHNEDVLFERERSLLPATQPLVEAEIAREKSALLRVDFHKEYAVINAKCEAEVLLLYEQVRQVRARYEQEKNTLRNVKYAEMHHREPAAQPRKVFIKACSYDDCRGFLSSQWKCGICERFTCGDCHVGKGTNRDDPNHTCKADDVATAKLIMSDTRGCPKCATSIFKVSGCDLMWCTQCHTAFSWTTGREDTGRNHNPHYFEWLRRTNGAGVAPHNPAHVVCGRELDGQFVLNLTREWTKNGIDNYEPVATKILQIIRGVMHMVQFDLPKYGIDRFRNNEELRVKYLRNRLTEPEFKRQLQIRMKKQEKFREIGDVLQLLANTTTEILYRFLDFMVSLSSKRYNKPRQNDQTVVGFRRNQIFQHTVLTEMDALIAYVNECLQRTSDTFASVPLQIVFQNNNMNLVNSNPKKQPVATPQTPPQTPAVIV